MHPARTPSFRSGLRRAAAGFTLIELLVSLTGGLFVSIAVFAMARDASRFYQREGRMANATLAAISGFERLRADIARAGFLVSPNVQSDPFVCSRPPSTGPSLLANLASVRIDNEGSPANATLASNAVHPDSILLAGSYSSSDQFPVKSVEQPTAGGVYLVYLQTETSAMARLGYRAATDATERTRLLASVFAAGRGLRLVDKEGRQHYGLIQAVTVDASGAQPYITLASSPAMVARQDQSRLCGRKGFEDGSQANVVNFIRYDLRNLSTASSFGGASTGYAALYAASAREPNEANRTELVRVELDASGDAFTLTESLSDGTTRATDLEELVAEYAVDLQFEVTAVNNTPPADPTLAHFKETAAQFGSLTGLPSSGATPQRLRTVRTRLSVRSREPDRDANVSGLGNNLYRIGLGPAGGAPFARVRTFQADIMLNNHSGVRW